MKSAEEIISIMHHATGTTAYHKISRFPGYPVITDGVKEVAEAAGCYWFLDIIASYQSNKKLDPDFQLWELTVNSDGSAVVRGYNDVLQIITQKISWTDFPLSELKVFLIRGVLLLPSKY